jgi:hypothetical protein
MTLLIAAMLYTCQTRNTETGEIYTATETSLNWADSEAAFDCDEAAQNPMDCFDMGCRKGR